MFGDSSKFVFCLVAFLRARVIETEKTELFSTESFFPFQRHFQPMKLASFLRTDSTAVLQWLHFNDYLPTCVANRVCERKNLTTVDQWFPVKKGNNPA